MTWTLISAILTAAALIFIQWLKTRNNEQTALAKKNEELERQAQEAREKEQAEDAKVADEIIASGDTKRAIGFLLDSFGRPSEPATDGVRPAGTSEGASP